MGLDALYGEGSAATFAGLCLLTDIFPSAESVVRETDCRDGAVHVEQEWTDADGLIAVCKIDFRPSTATYTDLSVEESYRDRGIYQALIAEHPAWFATLGIVALIATPADDQAEYILALGGFHWQEVEGERQFAARVDVPDRMMECRDWLNGGQEPGWHSELQAKPVL